MISSYRRWIPQRLPTAHQDHGTGSLPSLLEPFSCSILARSLHFFFFEDVAHHCRGRLAVGSYDSHVWRCAAAHLDGRTAAWPPRADHAAEFTLTFPSVAIFRVPTPDRSTRSSGQPCSSRRCMVHAVRALESPSHPSDHNVYGLIGPYIYCFYFVSRPSTLTDAAQSVTNIAEVMQRGTRGWFHTIQIQAFCTPVL